MRVIQLPSSPSTIGLIRFSPLVTFEPTTSSHHRSPLSSGTGHGVQVKSMAVWHVVEETAFASHH